VTDFSGLDIAGRIATPDDSDWDQARAAWNLVADQTPSAVALVESGDDVAKTVRFAAENGLRVSGQGTGHGAMVGADNPRMERLLEIELSLAVG
jgi:FAD/FMN-containing dehydrogenase